MEHDTTKDKYVTLLQFVEAHGFITLPRLRRQVYYNKEFEGACVRRLGSRVLIHEKNAMDYIAASFSRVKRKKRRVFPKKEKTGVQNPSVDVYRDNRHDMPREAGDQKTSVV